MTGHRKWTGTSGRHSCPRRPAAKSTQDAVVLGGLVGEDELARPDRILRDFGRASHNLLGRGMSSNLAQRLVRDNVALKHATVDERGWRRDVIKGEGKDELEQGRVILGNLTDS